MKKGLVLSGGGSRGSYQIGVWKALSELDWTPHVVTGSSVGAINGALVAQGDLSLALDLWQQLETQMLFDVEVEETPYDFQIGGVPSSEAFAYIKKMRHGGADTKGLENILRQYLDESRIRKSDINFGLVTVSAKSLAPFQEFTSNIPTGKLIDYILGSASCFPAVKSHLIDGDPFIDGGYYDVMPVELAMREEPTEVVSVYLEAAGFLRPSTITQAQENLDHYTPIKSHWNLGNFLVFDGETAKRNIQLGYLDTFKAFGRYQGKKFTFPKGTFTKKELKKADLAGYVFDLDPLKVYTKKDFFFQLKHRVLTAQLALKRKTISYSHFSPSNQSNKSLFMRGKKEEFNRKISDNALVTSIALDLEKNGANSFFLRKKIYPFFREEVLAASFIRSHQLLSK